MSLNLRHRKAIIFDMDGTLANISTRRQVLKKNPKDWNGFFQGIEFDLPNVPIVELFHTLSATGNYIMIVVTGRPERYRCVSTQWLLKHNINAELMYMRQDGDRRPDDVVKKEILEKIRSQELEIILAIDDRQSVVQMWRDNGVTCLQCDEGLF